MSNVDGLEADNKVPTYQFFDAVIVEQLREVPFHSTGCDSQITGCQTLEGREKMDVRRTRDVQIFQREV